MRRRHRGDLGDGDEKVDFGEFAGGLSVLCAGSREEKLKLVFAFVDADGNGSLSKAELMGFFTTLASRS